MKNKKANIRVIILFFLILFIILFVGFILAVGSGILNWVFDETIPELENLGTIENTNFTDIARYTVTPLNTLVQSFMWLTGVLYVLMLIGSFGFVLLARASPSKWMIGFYFGLALMLIMASMFISNMYEDFYDGTDDLATRLKEQTLLSFMILYSPMVFSIIVFATGIILFSGIAAEEEIA